MRRLFILSALFSVLLAMSQPLFACAMDMAAGDCCPAGTHDPCDAETGALTGGACPDTLLCAAASRDAPPVIAQTHRDLQPALPGTSPGADPPPHPAANSPPPAAGPDPASRQSRHAAFAAVHASLTYRNTARLRL